MVCKAALPPYFSQARFGCFFSFSSVVTLGRGGEVSVDYRLLVVINTLLPPLLATTSYYYTPVNGILETQAVSSYLTSYRTSSKPHGKAREKEQTRSVEHIRQFETGLIEDQHYIQGFSLAHTTSATN
jgi:hypothetical protein